ncbi:nuclear transport factor 2 family protein [Streptomyces malaysiensis]|uniref:nuclear transport factor 2 family protein n=1 Tax=Streptomyces malaysiensis TaxID=92644 RepID=UPI002B2F8DD8|nr:nuclear transport factor 2 family protein [Streptomyces malaysiensis]
MSDDRAEIQDLNSRYAIAFDSGRLDESVDCWAEDDRYVRVAGRWKFASRVITSSFPHEALTS